MAYVDAQPAGKRIAAVAGATAIQAGIAIALITGLSVVVPEIIPEDDVIGVNIELPVTPPPPPPDRADPVPDPVTPRTPPTVAQVAPINLFQDTAIPTTSELPPIALPPISGLVVESPQPPTAPAYTPTNPIPRNSPSGWVTTAEYPHRAITRGWEGEANYALSIGTNGQVEDCQITSSTGHRVLDQATCRWVSRRARFEPAKNNSGEIVPGTYSGRISWILPD